MKRNNTLNTFSVVIGVVACLEALLLIVIGNYGFAFNLFLLGILNFAMIKGEV